jgi:poly(hydroxyalkanoate) granule-associated protein
MARKIATSKSRTPARPTLGNVWLAGVGAVSLARRNGKALFGDMLDEGVRWRNETAKLVRESRADARAHIRGVIVPLRARFAKGVHSAGTALQSGTAAMLGRFGIPSKSDIEELTQRVATLSRQLKSVK